MPAIYTENLSKSYFTQKKEPGIKGGLKALFSPKKVEIKAVQEINLSIEQGELVGFLGPNGAGKTTTLKMLSGILYPTSGKAEVLGYVPNERKPEMLRKIALVMGNKNQLWWDLPAWESFIVLKELYEVDSDKFKRRTDQLIEALDLGDKIHTQVRKLSLGERMKCELVAALLHSPQVVFLDEPTIGLDVVSQKRIRDFLKELHAEDNNTLLLTSHYMQDVQELCKRVVVIDHGTVVFEGTLDYLSKKFTNTRRVRLTFSAPVDQADVSKYGKLVSVTEDTQGDGALAQCVIEVDREQVAASTSHMLQELPVNDLSVEEIEIEEVIRHLFTAQRK